MKIYPNDMKMKDVKIKEEYKEIYTDYIYSNDGIYKINNDIIKLKQTNIPIVEKNNYKLDMNSYVVEKSNCTCIPYKHIFIHNKREIYDLLDIRFIKEFVNNQFYNMYFEIDEKILSDKNKNTITAFLYKYNLYSSI